MGVEVIVEHAAWRTHLPALSKQAWNMVSNHLHMDPDHEICVLGCDDARIQALNGSFRQKDAPTNVLSWPSAQRPVPTIAHPFEPWVLDAGSPELGDMALAFETCQNEAFEQQKPFEAHVLHLLVHGMLHLLGFDHISEEEAAVMEATEVIILEQNGVVNPYSS